MIHKQRGFTLIELMISILIGLIILAAVMGMFVTMIKSDSDNLKSIRLNQELRAAMSLITRDLRRSGYNSAALTTVIAGTNPFQEMATTATCIIYAYDANKNGTDDGNSEHFGFRLNSRAIESRENSEDCTGTTNWDNITDENLVEILSPPDVLPLFSDNPNTSAGITTHQITISISGRLVSDRSVSRTITETVEIRNDEY